MVAEILAKGTARHPRGIAADVAAVITVEDDWRFFPDTLTAVLSQRVMPAMIIIVDCMGGQKEPVELELDITPVTASGDVVDTALHTVRVQVVGVDDAVSFADAVNKGIRQTNVGSFVQALWLLHDDSRPADDCCLEALTDTWRNTSTASLLGAKQLDWQGESLHDVGMYASKRRVVSLVVDGEPDQEQYDGRQDVFAVSLAGALVPLKTLTALGGVNSWFTTMGESIDFSRRVVVSGGRVVVVPRARIAHRRARYEGIRSRAGHALDEYEPNNPALGVMRVSQRYRYSETHRVLWPLMWLWSLLRALGLFVSQLVHKRPYEALCELMLPWLAVFDLSGALHARATLVEQSTVPMSQLSALVATGKQIGQWHNRRDAFESQKNHAVLSPLAKEHLHRRLICRWTIAVIMALVALVAVIVMQWDVFRVALAPGSLYSDTLLPTGASFKQLVRSATTSWVFGYGTGIPAPATPWLLVLMCASVITLGNVPAALTLMFFASAPLSALSFWALAGVFTRSDAVRAITSLLWVSFSFALGFYAQADLAMLTVMTFLPAAFAFAFRAVGMYRTEDPVRSRASVQSAALSALCFVPVIAAEPQLLFPLVVTFIAFVLCVREHRMMLWLIPLPSAIVCAPSLMNAVRYAPQGLWRALFGDITIPSTGLDGAPQALSLVGIVSRAFGVDIASLQSGLTSTDAILALIVVSVLVLLALASLITLVLPFGIRASRMMWVVVLAGVLLSCVSGRVTVGVDTGGLVAGSTQPGVVFALVGMMSCLCLVSGASVQRFMMLRPGALSRVARSSSHSASVAVAARAVLVMILAAASIAGVSTQMMRSKSGTVGFSNGGLPMVAVDYLQQDDSHRVLALRAESTNQVSFTVMRTQHGDLIDSSPAQRAQYVTGQDNADIKTIATAVARLLANPDADAIAQLSDLGFGGIYVSFTSNADDVDATTQLTSNITASNGTQSVVSSDEGTYYRLTVSAVNKQGIDTSWQRQTQSSRWRYAWLWCTGIVMCMYCLVALPRLHGGIEESV